jgi:hypothetical protein
MMTVVDANLILFVIALAIGFVIGWWMFRRARTGADVKLDVDSQARPYLDPPAPDPSPPAMLRGIRNLCHAVGRSATVSIRMSGAASPIRALRRQRMSPARCSASAPMPSCRARATALIICRC